MKSDGSLSSNCVLHGHIVHRRALSSLLAKLNVSANRSGTRLSCQLIYGHCHAKCDNDHRRSGPRLQYCGSIDRLMTAAATSHHILGSDTDETKNTPKENSILVHNMAASTASHASLAL